MNPHAAREDSQIPEGVDPNSLSHMFTLDELVPPTGEGSEDGPKNLQKPFADAIQEAGDILESPNEAYVVPKKKRNRHESLSERKNKALVQKYEAEIVRLREEKEAMRHQALHQAQEAIGNAEDALRFKQKQAEYALAAADEEGRSDLKAEATRLMTEFSVQQMELQRQKEAIQNSQYHQEDYGYVDPSYYNEEPVSDPRADEAYSEWLDRNQWANPSSEKFDRALYEEACQIKESLDKELALSDKDDLRGIPQYFNEISIRLKRKYGVGRNDSSYYPPEPQPQTQGYPQMRSHVLPGRSSSPSDLMGSPREPHDVKLTRQQMEIAVKTIGYNNPHMTDAQRINRYKQLILMDKKKGTYGTNQMEIPNF